MYLLAIRLKLNYEIYNEDETAKIHVKTQSIHRDPILNTGCSKVLHE